MAAMRVDGNVLAGVLAGELGTAFADPTILIVVCGGCGAESVLAEVVVELDDRCAIVLCRSCTHTLFTVLRGGEGMGVTFGAVAELRLPGVDRPCFTRAGASRAAAPGCIPPS